MGRSKYIENPDKLLEPNREFQLPLKRNSTGNYQVLGKRVSYSGITKTNKKRFPDGCLYFIKLKDMDVYKIGVSQNIKRRLSDIDSNLPFDFEILSIHEFKNVYDIEEDIKKELEGKKLKREWFRLSTDEAKAIMMNLHNLNISIENGTSK